MNYWRYVIDAFFACVLLTPSQGLPAIPLPSAERDIQQQQRERLEQSERQRESLQQQQQIDATSEEVRNNTGPCYFIQHIVLRNASILTSEEKHDLIMPYENRCLTLSSIQSLVNEITNIYVSRGLITSRAWLQDQDVTSGRLTIDILEGRIEDFQYNGQSGFITEMAFPGLKGEILNLRDLEQGMEQVNRLTTRPVTIDIQPGILPAHSLVHLKSDKTRWPLKGSFGADNSGQRSTGRGQINGSLILDNPVGLIDQWRFTGSHSNDFYDDHRSRQFSAGVTLPYGYWLFSYSYGWNDSLQTIAAGDAKYRYTGSTESHRLGVERVLFRDGQQRLTINAGLTRRKNLNMLAGERLTVSSPTLAVAEIGFSWSRTLAGGYLTFNPSISQGLHVLGATTDSTENSAAPRAQFRKVTLSASYFYPLTESVNYLTSFFAQATPYALYSSEQISAGGQYSVRGYQDQYLTGNRGGYWRQEIGWQIHTIPWLGQLGLMSSVDVGWIDREQHKVDGGTLSGIAAGLSLTGEWLSQSLQLGAPLTHPDGLHADKAVIYWQAEMTI